MNQRRTDATLKIVFGHFRNGYNSQPRFTLFFMKYGVQMRILNPEVVT